MKQFIAALEASAAARGETLEHLVAEAGLLQSDLNEPTVDDLVRAADYLECTTDELLGREKVPNAKRPVGEELVALGITPSWLKKLATSMVESRVQHAFDAVVHDDRHMERKIDNFVETKLSGIAEQLLRERLQYVRLNVNCVLENVVQPGPDAERAGAGLSGGPDAG